MSLRTAIVATLLAAAPALAAADTQRWAGDGFAVTATTAERAKRTEEALGALAASVDRLQMGLLAQRKEAATLRGQIADVIEGPPTMRRPAVGPPTADA